ncbi:hypothetical protein WA1_05335 [Scytonema hofmannii PCC 7110]|uniref:Uncharacterized protein n=1 Tax=Scytonema hofmannii PCC 7110 TaxID=128403 RepID=A0A139WZS7_9CYAN|nr:hypothetical protein [Scytonema hofmannii]KYC37920.1 hypothetical protein WA1_05335 [Scytonema hofmannii PCC 7110]
MASLNLSKVNFNQRSNVIDPGTPIFNPKSSIVNTGGGADKIIGTDSINGDFGFGVLAGVEAQDFNAVIASNAFSARANVAANGINNKGVINTGIGADQVKGTATANISATAETVSQAIAIAKTADTSVISKAFASINVKVTADGIDNSGGKINNGMGSDGIYGDTEGSVAAVAIATADASAIVEAVAKAPVSPHLTAFALAIAESLASATIIARGINNKDGTMTTGMGADTISATATSSAATLSYAASSAVSSAPSENQALAQSVVNAFAEVKDIAIAIDNSKGTIRTGDGQDIIIAKAEGGESYGIFGGIINMGNGADTLEASSFGGSVNINMGDGKDFVQGFGDAKIDGGVGFDTLSLGYKIDDFNISLGANNNKVMFERDGIAMNTTHFEQFVFDNGNLTLSYNQLSQYL